MERISYQDISEKLIESMLSVNNYIDKTNLSKKLIELIKLRCSQINGCAYCIDMHYKEAINEGDTELRLYSLSVWKETPFFSDKEKAALGFAEAITLISENDLDDDIYAPLLNHFSKNEIADLTLVIAQINSWNRLMKTFKFTPGNYEVNR